MAGYDYDIGILGGGSAGLTVAAGAAQLGARTLLVEKEEKLGGDCLHYGCVPSKTLIRSATVYHRIKNAEKYGLPKMDVPPADYRDIARRIQNVIDSIQVHDSPERFCRLGAQVEFGVPNFKDEHTIRLNDKIYSAKQWVIATGSSPGIPRIDGLDKTAFITNKEIFSLDELPKSMIVLGAGPVAIEMAQSFCRLGTDVTVIQRSDQILSKEDKDMADLVMEALKREGIKFHLNSKVVRTDDLGGKKKVQIQSDNNQIILHAEMILVALGREANLNGLGLEQIGVERDSRGLRVDDRLRTTQRHIYAGGDVTGAHQFTHAAGYEGGVIVTNAIFHVPRKVNYTFLPWATYCEPELASIGMNEKRAKEAGLEYSVWTEEFNDNDRAHAEGERSGKVKLLLNSEEKPIGVQILGLHGGELVNEWVAALNGKIKLTTLAASMHPYPTLGEINKKVAGALLSQKLFSDKVRKGLKFFFGFKGRACG